MAWVEEDTGHKTRVIGRMQTPYRVALFRMIASLFLFGMAICGCKLDVSGWEQSLA